MNRVIRSIAFLACVFFFVALPVAVPAEAASPLCWTAAQCAEHNPANTFELKSKECKEANLGYCYAPVGTYKLIKPLGQVTDVQGVTGYVSALYSLVIVIASIGAVLTIMIAGLKWMTARGNPGPVGEAKQMIGKALVSVIILMSVVTIANLIDPNLTLLNLFRTPLVKTVNFIAEGESCEALQGVYNMEISPKTGLCGAEGTILSLGDGESRGAEVTGVKVGDKCIFSGCADNNLGVCIGDATGKYACHRCGNISNQTKSETNITPSNSVCSRLTFVDIDRINIGSDAHISCRYHEANKLSVNWSGCVETVYPSDAPGLDCERLRSDKGNMGCSAYDWVVGNNVAFKSTGDVSGGWSPFSVGASYLSKLNGSSLRFDLLQNVCNAQDICKVAKDPGGCQVYIPSTDYAQCVPAGFTPPGP